MTKASDIVFCETAKKLRQKDILDRVTQEPDSGCWLWRGPVRKDGYAQVTIAGIFWLGHRLAYEVFRGPIPKHLEIDHLCRIRRCVNPDHLELVAHSENVIRGNGGAKQRKKTHCPRGHEYRGTNLYVNSQGARVCRACGKENRRKYYVEGKKRREARRISTRAQLLTIFKTLQSADWIEDKEISGASA